MDKTTRIADETIYCLLHQGLNRRLHRCFEMYQNRLTDGFEDVIDDFFLYLRDGKNGTDNEPFQSLRRIRNKEALGAWMVKTFRNYLSMQAAKNHHIINEADDSPSVLTDEQKLNIASNLIAYAHQTLPNDDMAQALGMTGLSYRVAVHRTKSNLAKYRDRLLCGECLPLDDAHQQSPPAALRSNRHHDARSRSGIFGAGDC